MTRHPTVGGSSPDVNDFSTAEVKSGRRSAVSALLTSGTVIAWLSAERTRDNAYSSSRGSDASRTRSSTSAAGASGSPGTATTACVRKTPCTSADFVSFSDGSGWIFDSRARTDSG